MNSEYQFNIFNQSDEECENMIILVMDKLYVCKVGYTQHIENALKHLTKAAVTATNDKLP